MATASSEVKKKGPRASVAIKAKNKSSGDHPKKRIVLTYISLAIIRDQLIKGTLDPKTTQGAFGSVSVQSSQKSHPPKQGAHQTLGEIEINKVPAYSVVGLELRVSQALLYCFAATSDIYYSYNKADNYVERAARPKIAILLNEIIAKPTVKSQTYILARVCGEFGLAVKAARVAFGEDLNQRNQKIASGQPPKEDAAYGDSYWGELELIFDEYAAAMRDVANHQEEIAGKTVDYWIDEILGKAMVS
jgi:hypothetical protein